MSCCLHTGGINLGSLFQQQLHDGSGTHHAEVPIILYRRAAMIGIVVGVAFHHHIQVGVLF